MLRPAQLTDSLRRLVGSTSCLLCDSGHGTGLICSACDAGLPWNHHACRCCARPVASADIELCGPCTQRRLPFDSAVAAFRYTAPVDQAIQKLKYSADFLAARWLADALVQAVQASPQPLPEILLPVPLHAGRLRRRGYNQAQELARAAGKRLGVAVDAGLARRVRATEDQIGKSAADRRRNLRAAFAVDARIKGCCIALVDDVMTTGSTLAELARACRRAGAKSVDAWVIARVE